MNSIAEEQVRAVCETCHERCRALRQRLVELEEKYQLEAAEGARAHSDTAQGDVSEGAGKLEGALWQELRSLSAAVDDACHEINPETPAWPAPAASLEELRERIDQIEAGVSGYPQIEVLRRATRIHPKEGAHAEGVSFLPGFNLFHDRVESMLGVVESARPEEVRGRLEQARILIEAIAGIVRLVEDSGGEGSHPESAGHNQLKEMASKVFDSDFVSAASKGQFVFASESHTKTYKAKDQAGAALKSTHAEESQQIKEKAALPSVLLTEEQRQVNDQLEALAKVFEVHSAHEVIAAAMLQRQIGHIDFTSMTAEEAQGCAQMLQTWFGLGAHRSAFSGDIRQILDTFGLYVEDTQNENNSRMHFLVRFKSIHPKWVPEHVVGCFDSLHYRLLCFWGSPPLSMLEAEMKRLADQGNPLLIFYFGPFSLADRRELSQLCRQLKQEVIVVDDLLATHLCVTRASKPITLFGTILPYGV